MANSLTVPRLLFRVAVAVLCAASSLHAVPPPPAQIYYVPFPEDNQLAAFAAVNSASLNPLAVFITFACASDNTVIWYDHWEDGYEKDIFHPVQPTTLVFGDGNMANDYPPGNPGDMIPAGTVFSLRNFVDTTTLQSVFDYDARDKIASSKSISVTKTTFPQSTRTLLAGCFEVYEYGLWGVEFRSPVGVDMPTTGTNGDYDMFAYNCLVVSAGPAGAHVQIDKDNNGSYEETVTLTEGQSVFREAVNVGGHILSDQPVQVVLFNGRPGSNYQSRDTSLTPVYRWGSSYYTPVSTPATSGGTPSSTVVFLYNPGNSAITVTYDYRSSPTAYTSASISVPAGGYAKTPSLTNGLAYHFYTSGAEPPVFYPFSAVDGGATNTANNQAWDGGFALISQPSLSTQVLLSLGIGRDPYSLVNPTENGNPVYVTTVGNGHTPATIYVDYNGDNAGPLTDPNGNHYDVVYTPRELEQLKLFDPDGDQSGMLIYSLDENVKIAAVWAQDPALAAAGEPGVDVATIIPPLREGAAGKASTVVVDADGDGYTSAGDTLEYDIRISNIARTPIPGPFHVQDTLPAHTTYVPGSTQYRLSIGGYWAAWVPIPDNGTGTAFPLDDSGFDVPGALGFGQSAQVVFRAVVDTYATLAAADRITNTGNVEVSPYGVQIPLDWTDLLYGSIGDRVWEDSDGDGVQDAGEGGLNGIIVWADLDNDNVRDADEPWSTTAGDGNYVLTGLLAGTYVVRVDPASLAAIDPRYGPTYDLDGVATSYVASVALAAAQDRTDVDFGFRTGASVGDRVWVDRNGNGVQENGEPGINNVRVYIDLNHNNTYDVGEPNSFTFGDGTYYIGNLNPGAYEVRVDTTTLPTGTTQTYDFDGVGTAHEAAVTLTTVHNDLVDFGYRGSLSIGDLVWDDLDGSGTRAAAYNVYSGRIDLNRSGASDNSDDGYLGTVQVIDGYLDLSGNGTIGAEDAGVYQGVTVIAGALDTNASGTISSADNGTIPSEPGIANVRVYIDANGNGVWDPTEAYATTNSAGAYSITNLFNGTYTVRVDTTTMLSSYVETYDLTAPTTDNTATVALSGSSRTDVDFGYRNDASLGDLVWNDRNANGVRDAGEPGIAGVLVYVDANANGTFDVGERSATTDLNGYYLINYLAAGTHSVRVEIGTLPQGSTQTYDLDGTGTANVASRTLVGPEDATNVDFGYRASASLGDRVWTDTNANGVQDGGETGISGVRVYVDSNGNGVYDAATEPAATTDASGNYTIANLTAGTYTVRVDTSTLPAGVVETYDLTGALDHAATVTVAANQTRTDVDFGYVTPVTIGDFVWYDANANGQQDSGETGLAGVPVTVYRANGSIAATTTSSGTGAYLFNTLLPGTYYVEFGNLAGYARTPADQGADATDSDANVTSGKTGNITLTAGQANLTLDGGYDLAASVGDFVWVDTNGNGQQDGGEPGLYGATVNLYRPGYGPDGIPGNGDDAAVIATTISAANGAYSFGSLPGGNYVVGFADVPGYARTVADQGADSSDSDANVSTGLTATVTLAYGQTNSTLDAGFYQPTSLAGAVRLDVDGDGFVDAEDTAGIPGVTVLLLNAAGTVVASTATSTTGTYSFTNQPPGTYTVVQLLPAGYTNTYDVVEPNDREIPRTLVSGQNSTGNDFYDTRTPVERNKFLYLSDPSQALDRVDPVATSDGTTATTATLGTGASTITVVGAAASSSSGQTVSSYSFSYNSGTTGSNRILMVGISYRNNDSETVTSVTYAGQSLTQVGTDQIAVNTPDGRIYIYRLLNPPTGANTLAVTWNSALNQGAVVGAVTYSGVDQTTPTGTFASANGTSTAPAVTVTSASGHLVFAVVGGRTTSDYAISGTGGTSLWSARPFSGQTAGAGQSKAGAASVVMSWTGTNDEWVAGGVSLRPATGGVASTAFTQSPAFALPFGLAAGASIQVTAYVNVISGTMPASPTLSAVLSVGGTPFMTLSSPTYSGGLLTWTGSLGSNVNIAAGQAIALTVTTTQSGVTFQIRYDSLTYPSKIRLPTTSIIAIPAFDVYDAAYPNGSPLTDASISATRYVRIRVTDPFGASDITDVNLAIDGPGVTGDLTTTLGAGQVVASDAWSKTYEYVWNTLALAGTYTLNATANEGTEGINATGTTTDILYASTFGDRVWDDLNGDGVQGASEPGIPGVRVYVDSNGNGSYDSGEPNATTDANGTYSIGNLAAGTYTARVDTSTLPSGLTTQTYDLNGALDHSASVTLTVNQTRTDVDYGYRGAGSIGDRIFADVNNNGVWDTGEGISGVDVTIVGDMDGDGVSESVTVTTGSDGLYTLSGLRATAAGMSYTVTVDTGDLPAGLTTNTVDPDTANPGNSTSTVSLTTALPNRLDQDFGYRGGASIAGQVRKDTDGDGDLADSEYPIVNVLVELHYDSNGNGVYDNGEPLVASANTDGDGRYSFSGFAWGKYVVVETDPVDYSSTNDFDGNAGSNGFNQIAVNVVAATAYTGRDFLDQAPDVPTVAVVSRLGVTLAEFGPVVRWETASEVGSTAFNLYRETADGTGRTRVTAVPILAGGEPQGGTYAVVDDGATPGATCRYWVEELQTADDALFHGPFVLTLPTEAGACSEVAGDGVSPLPPVAATGKRALPVSLVLGGVAHPVNADKAARAKVRVADEALTGRLATGKATSAAKAALPPAAVVRTLTTRMKIPITAEGLQYLSVSAIATGLGITPDAVRYGIQYRQLQVACQARTVGSVGAAGGEGLYFYGQPPVSPYTKTNIYWLEKGLVPALSTLSGRKPAPVSGGSFLDVLHLEQDVTSLVAVVAAPEDGLWAWQALVPSNPFFSSMDVYGSLPYLGATAGEAGLTVRLHGGSDSAAPIDHRVEVSVNGTVVGQSEWDGIVPQTADLIFPAALLQSGVNTITLRALLAEGVTDSICYLDWVDVIYPRTYTAVNNQLAFGADGNRTITVTGFTDPAIQVFDITNPTRTLALNNLTIGPAATPGTYAVSLMPANPAANRYVAFVPAALATPSGTPVAPSTLRDRTTKAEHVIIAPPDMVAAAEALALHRRRNGLTSMVVSLAEVYDEFNEGLAEPAALRDFLTTAYSQWRTGPRYVVLIGDGTYDYCNVQGRNDNILPPLLTRNAYGLFASDVSLGDVRNDDGAPEIAVGRLPVMNAAELSAVIAKIAGYETAAAGTRPVDVVLGADIPDAGGDFPLDADALAAGILAGTSPARVYLSELPLADARLQFLQLLTGGARSVNWVGHGGMDRLSRSGLLTSADVATLAIPNNRLAVLVAASCVINRFELPGYDSLGERLVLKADGGSVAVWAPSALAYNSASKALDQGIYAAMYGRSAPRLGDAVLQALRGLSATAAVDGGVDARRVYTLLGDPGMKLQTKGR